MTYTCDPEMLAKLLSGERKALCIRTHIDRDILPVVGAMVGLRCPPTPGIAAFVRITDVMRPHEEDGINGEPFVNGEPPKNDFWVVSIAVCPTPK